MVDIKTLLPELRKLVLVLAEDLLARATSDKQIDAGLREAFNQIEKGGRTAQVFEVWRDDYLDQVAVAWVLACVFVRFMEDNDLIEECWLAGEGDRRKLAEDSHELFFRAHPHDTDREYFQYVFHEVGKIPAAKDLFAEGKTPLWAVAPTGDAAMNLLKFWREMNAKTGHLKRSFEVESGDTRFLGDLYQELSERAKKKFALLQTPVFVEEFILDRTLTPALDEFGLQQVRMIDPTCGSGHFLLGGFARLFREWCKRESNEIKAAQNALDNVWGVDINPFAVAIARFRLIVAAVQACGINRLKNAPAWKVHLATGDSLLFGSRWNSNGTKREEVRYLDDSWAPEVYACEDKEAIKEVLGQQYHVVVGNPPYIIVRDRVLNGAYRDGYSTCAGKYSLGVPFTQRFWELSLSSKGETSPSGYIGLITTNSFMKREFGKKLIEAFFPKVDLTHVLDTSGAYIPGHMTPTVILLGRNRPPVGQTIRAVLGIKGEPRTPSDAAKGVVWQSLLRHIDNPNNDDGYTSSADVLRATFSQHPWSIGGGGASDIKSTLEETSDRRLGDIAASIGVVAILGEDDAFVADQDTLTRIGVCTQHQITFVEGDTLRDWVMTAPSTALFPYAGHGLTAELSEPVRRRLWPYRELLRHRLMFGKNQIERGLQWYEYGMIIADKFNDPLSISFAFVASHNHFVLDRGEKAFNRSAPVIKLPQETSEETYFQLLGLLNSSTACFWMKQVFYPKSTAAKDIDAEGGKPEANRYEFTATGLLSFPVPSERKPEWLRIAEIAKALDECGLESVSLLPNSILSQWRFDSDVEALISDAEKRHTQLKRRMVALQEELDWEVYKLYGLTADGCAEAVLSDIEQGIQSDERPFVWTDEKAPKDIPVSWRPIYERRRSIVMNEPCVRMIETAVFKRPWWGRQGIYGRSSRNYGEWVGEASHDWLLRRLESRQYWSRVELQTTAGLADKVSRDSEFMQVASLYRKRSDFDLAALVAELVEGDAVPLLPILRFNATGLRKRGIWERTWELQREEDAGKIVSTIPVPPKYATADYLKSSYGQRRGKLDVPKERWISYPHCSTESDPSLLVGWAGWNHLEQATALVGYYDARKREGVDAKRLTPLLAGLNQLLPWIHQWHPEIDPEFGETAGQSYETMLKQDAHELGLTLDDIRNWEPPASTSGRERKRT